MTKLAPEWVRTNDPVIRSPARYRWTTAPALNSPWVLEAIQNGDKISLCSNNEDILAHWKQIFVCHANIVHFVNTLDVVLYLNIWHPFGVVQLYQFEVTLNNNNHNSVGWNIRSFSTLCWHQWIHCMNRMSKHTLTKFTNHVQCLIHHTYFPPSYLTSHRPHYSGHLLY